MENIGKEIIIEQVKGIIKGGIERFAKKANVDKKRMALWIYAEDNTGYPTLKLLLDLKKKDDITFGDLANKLEKILYQAVFDIEKDTPVWIQKFILRSAKDVKLEVTVPKYLLAIFDDDELHAFMYVNGKNIKEISIEYILETN